MSRSADVPAELRFAPFRGSAAIAHGLLTRGRLAGPSWRRLFDDVYIHRDARVDAYVRCRAVGLLLPPGAALSHRAAAFAYGADVLGPEDPVEVTGACRLRTRPGLTVVRSALERTDVWRRGGLRVTSPVRTAFDLARDPDLTAAVIRVDALLGRRAVKPEAIAAYLAAHPNWRHVRHARQALALAREGVESPMETRLRLTVVTAGLPEPVVQHDVFDAAGRFVGRLDLAYPERRVGLEYDGDHHRGRDTFRRDAVRLNRLRLAGWTVLRFTADDLTHAQARMLAQIRAALK
ncbi:hypothetical protein Val02_03670 [Virgisporangium aliadipatigenens]|uniref:DUF559 domain-containing protein n=1 Tax=Virgisporangium aliadipatigenens TaxID=741659 RepID=A0A8J4DN57_9ACTN|nr:DUF559 domain-containing protein [Virgisporangium aliadipatigenens]GIJ43481.1 hypothetical protein Val02_03670 [Virgisporangium aliadipatigenens]